MIGMIGVCVACIVIQTVVIVKQIQRENRLEEIANQAIDNLYQIQTLIESSEKLLNENPRLKEAFSHDDEVGDYFKNLKQIQEDLYEYFKGEGENEEE